MIRVDTNSRVKVEGLNIEYQQAIKNNDVATMDLILDDNFIFTTGKGKAVTKLDLLEDARTGRFIYEHHEDYERIVRVWEDTAVVTALLWAKGKENGSSFNYRVWFSDTYAVVNELWKCVFRQFGTRTDIF